MPEYGATEFDKLCHNLFAARDNGVDFHSRNTGVSCGRCGHELVAYYCESRLYMVQCRHCKKRALVMAQSRTEAAEKTFGQADHLQNGVGFHGIPIEELDLSILSYNALKRSGINTIEELKEWDEERLLSVRNTGKKIVAEVMEKLAEWEKRRASDG